MSAWLSAIDAVLTAVAAGATVTAVVIAKRTLRSSQAAEQQMAATAQHLAAIAGPIRETAETLGRLQQAVHAEAAVAQARGAVEVAKAAVAAFDAFQDGWYELKAGVNGLATADLKAQRPYQQAQWHFRLALRGVAPDEEGDEFREAWKLAKGHVQTSWTAGVRTPFERLMAVRQDELQAAEVQLHVLLQVASGVITTVSSPEPASAPELPPVAPAS